MITRKTIAPAKTKKTYVAFVLDKSGSMSSIKDATISSFNEQIQQHRLNAKLGGDVSLTLVTFNSEVSELLFNVPLDEVVGELDGNEYVPCGGTALYDAVYKTTQKLQRFDEEGDIAFLVIVLSDGQENSSRIDRSGKLTVELRKELEATGRWTFQYIGCDAAAIKEATETLGLNASVFEKTTAGVGLMSKTMVANTAAFYTCRSAGATSVADFGNLATRPIPTETKTQP